jgi:hypothetical protein
MELQDAAIHFTSTSFPYFYTLSKKGQLAFARLADSMVLPMMRGPQSPPYSDVILQADKQKRNPGTRSRLNGVVKVREIGCDCLRRAGEPVGDSG